MKRTLLSLASLAIVLAAAACASSVPTEPGDARFDNGMIGSGTATGGGGGGEAPASDTTGRGGGTIGSGT